MGLKTSDDVGLRLDLLAEVFVDGAKVGQGELDNVVSGSTGFNNALLNTIPLTLTGGGPVSVPLGSQLSIRVSARRTCLGTGHNSGTARLWYDGKAVDSGAGRDAGSRFDATIGVTADYFLRSGAALSTTAGSSRTSADVIVNNSGPCPARPFTSFGTWSETLP